MMSNDYSLPLRKARICRLAGAVFLLCAICTALGIATIAIWPGPSMQCGAAGCVWTSRPSIMLDDDEMAKVQASPVAERIFDAHVARPIVRLGIAGITAIESVPFAILLLGVGVGLRRLGGRADDPLARALPWLRRASQAALVWAVARPLSESLMESLLSIGTPSGAHWYINVDLLDIGTAVMLGSAAYATVWALEAGLRAQRDLAEIV